MKRKSLTVRVTKRHLDKAVKAVQNNTSIVTEICPVAQAVRKYYPKALIGYSSFRVKGGSFICEDAAQITVHADTINLRENNAKIRKLREKLPMTLTFKFHEANP